MTNVISRYIETAGKAKAVRKELVERQNFPAGIISLYMDADGLAETLTKSNVAADTAAAYAGKLAGGGAVMVIRAGFKPLGVAKIARTTLAAMGVAETDGLVEEVKVKEEVKRGLNILSDHRRMLTRMPDPDATNFYMANWPIPLISRRKPFTGSIIKPHAKMADIDHLLPLPIPGADREPFDEFPFFDRHARMANFPLPLISKRKPKDRFAFPRHARMANFPIGLISGRKPKDRFAFPRHARMADMILPLIIHRDGPNAPQQRQGWSLSKALGFGTIIRR